MPQHALLTPNTGSRPWDCTRYEVTPSTHVCRALKDQKGKRSATDDRRHTEPHGRTDARSSVRQRRSARYSLRGGAALPHRPRRAPRLEGRLGAPWRRDADTKGWRGERCKAGAERGAWPRSAARQGRLGDVSRRAWQDSSLPALLALRKGRI